MTGRLMGWPVWHLNQPFQSVLKAGIDFFEALRPPAGIDLHGVVEVVRRGILLRLDGVVKFLGLIFYGEPLRQAYLGVW